MDANVKVKQRVDATVKVMQLVATGNDATLEEMQL